jgi:tetratricopeptide (TPR) repeat protein
MALRHWIIGARARARRLLHSTANKLKSYQTWKTWLIASILLGAVFYVEFNRTVYMEPIRIIPPGLQQPYTSDALTDAVKVQVDSIYENISSVNKKQRQPIQKKPELDFEIPGTKFSWQKAVQWIQRGLGVNSSITAEVQLPVDPDSKEPIYLIDLKIRNHPQNGTRIVVASKGEAMKKVANQIAYDILAETDPFAVATYAYFGDDRMFFGSEPLTPIMGRNPRQQLIRGYLFLNSPPTFDEGISVFQDYHREYPKDDLTWTLLAEVFLKNGRDNEGISAYRKVTQVNPKDARAFLALGDMLQQQGKVVDAIQAYGDGLKANHKYTLLYYQLGKALRQHRELPRAIGVFRTLVAMQIAMGTDPSSSYEQLGSALVEAGQPKEAIEIYRKELKFDPSNPEAYKGLALAIESTGDLGGAIKAAEQGLALTSFPELNDLLARLKSRLPK